MTKNGLNNFIINKEFDQFQNGLEGRFSAYSMEYKYCYDNVSVIVILNKDGVGTYTELDIHGILSFIYTDKNNVKHSEKFKNCVPDDFHTMLAHAFIYIKDGNFDHHKRWYNNLKKI